MFGGVPGRPSVEAYRSWWYPQTAAGIAVLVTVAMLPSPRRIPRPVRAARNAAQRLYDTALGVEQITGRLAVVSRQLETATARLDVLEAESRNDRQAVLDVLERDQADYRERQAHTLAVLQLLSDDEPANRQRLWRLRESAEYARAFEEPEPLVSFCIATYTNTKVLLERALPSLLCQTYERIEVVVVGDAASPEVERAVKSIGDPRVRYANMTFRGPYPDDSEQRWYVAGGPPVNEAMRLARGRWIAPMDDDDESAPGRAEVLLRAARERELEFAYGQLEVRAPDTTMQNICVFPPELGKIGLQCSLMHGGLRFICPELGDALFGLPGDWSRIRRMMRIGVRMGMIDDVVVHYYPNRLWGRQDA